MAEDTEGNVTSHTAAVDAMNALLADDCILFLKTIKAHWEVPAGPFDSLHNEWIEQLLGLSALIHETGPRIRSLGGYPLATTAQLLRSSSLAEDVRPVEHAHTALAALRADHEQVTAMLSTVIPTIPSNRAEDVTTLDFLTRAKRFHRACARTLDVSIGEHAPRAHGRPA